MGIFSYLAEALVDLPGRVTQSQLQRGIEAVRQVVLAESRRQEEERQAEERRRAAEQSPGSGNSWSGIRFKTAANDYDPPLHVRKVPPNLHAAVLSFPARLLMYVNEKCGGSGPMAYKRAGVKRNVYSRIVSDDGETADKRTVLQFCIGLQLNRPEADLLLKSAGYAFSETLPVDYTFAYCIEHQIWNIEDVNAMLSANGLK